MVVAQLSWREFCNSFQHVMILSAILLLTLQPQVSTHLNLFLTKPEVRRLFGLDAELYYVREGVANTYALNFTVPVPANLTKLHFNWQGLMKRPMSYLALVEYDNGAAMALPTLNISSNGYVPTNVTSFSLALPCSGIADGEVQVNLHLNISTAPRKPNSERNVTNVTIRRKKICLKGETFLPRNESIYEPPSLFVAMGVASTATVLVITLASLIYLKIKRERERQSLNCQYYSGPSYLGVGNSSTIDGRRLPGGARASSMRSNSYATIASLKKFPLSSKSPTKEAFDPQGIGTNGTNVTNNSYVGSLHYASSPLSHLYPHKYSQGCSPSHSLINSRLSQNSWRSPSSQSSWRDPRQNDPSERIKQLTVDRWRVVVGDLLQEGTFGRVHQGLCHDPLTQKALNVLVKTVSGDSSSAQARLVMREGLLLAGLRHQNLLAVLGVCTHDPRRPLLLYPHQEQINLKIYLRGNSKKGISFPGKKLLTRDAVQVAIGVCQGLMHLHHQRILHKDIATRNCMVDKDLQVKLTDTALSRDLFPLDYHCLGDNENRPIKWLSPEAVLHNRFSSSSDVWMFGVLLWELMTGAQQPYIEIDPFEMAAYLRDGYRLSQPHSCPDDLFGVMAICWAPAPEDRPTLSCLSACLQEFHSALSTFV